MVDFLGLAKVKGPVVISRLLQVAVVELLLLLASHLLCDYFLKKDHKYYARVKRGINGTIGAIFFVLFGLSLNMETTPIEHTAELISTYFYQLAVFHAQRQRNKGAETVLKPLKTIVKPLLGDDCRLKVVLETKNRVNVFCQSHIEKYPRFAGSLRPELFNKTLKTGGKGFNRIIELTRVQFNPDGVLALKDHILERPFKLTYPANVPPDQALDYAYGKVRSYMESFLLNMHQKEAFYGPLETKLKEQIFRKAQEANSTFRLMQNPNSSEIIEPVKEFILNTVTQNITKTPIR
jgi:hypothetical protein